MSVGASVEPKGGKMLDKAIAGSFSQLEEALLSTTYVFLHKGQDPEIKEKLEIARELSVVLQDSVRDHGLIKNFREPVAINEPVGMLRGLVTSALKSVEEKGFERVFGEIGAFITKIVVTTRDLGYSTLTIVDAPQLNQIDIKYETVTLPTKRTCVISFKDGAMVEFSVTTRNRTTGTLG